MDVLLLVTILVPIIGAGMVWAMSEAGRQPVRMVALVVSLVTLVLAIIVVSQAPSDVSPGADETADRAADEFVVFDASWFGGPQSTVDIRFSLGLDGLSVWMFGLSALLLVTCVLVSWEAIVDQAAGFYALLLLLGTGLLGVFAARDIILFYVFFEFTLIPLFFLIGVWGHEDRRYAAIKFFLFTLAGSLLTFVGLLAIVLWDYAQTGQLVFSIHQLARHMDANPMSHLMQVWVFLALFAGFAIKVPLFPFHTWLPLAHVQAPTAGSVMLAGVLLKIGTYGFVRFSLPMLPEGAAACTPWVLWLSVAGIVYGALVALAQSDLKKLIAYSSVSHLGFCMVGVFALNRIGMQGGVLQMINHGLSTGGLFAMVGMIYERYHTREIAQLGGMAKRAPLLATFFLIFTFSSIGLPGLNGFAGEFLLLNGMFQSASMTPGLLGHDFLIIAVLAVSGVVLGAWYMLWLVQRVFFGPLKEPSQHGASHPPVKDLNSREVAALAPLVVMMFWIGLQPGYFLERTQQTLDPIADSTQRRFFQSLASDDEPASQTASKANSQTVPDSR